MTYVIKLIIDLFCRRWTPPVLRCVIYHLFHQILFKCHFLYIYIYIYISYIVRLFLACNPRYGKFMFQNNDCHCVRGLMSVSWLKNFGSWLHWIMDYRYISQKACAGETAPPLPWASTNSVVFQCVPIMQINTASPLGHHSELPSASGIPVYLWLQWSSSVFQLCKLTLDRHWDTTGCWNQPVWFQWHPSVLVAPVVFQCVLSSSIPVYWQNLVRGASSQVTSQHATPYVYNLYGHSCLSLTVFIWTAIPYSKTIMVLIYIYIYIYHIYIYMYQRHA